MPSVTVRCCTWNVGDEGPPEDDLSHFLGVTGTDTPDVIAVALQEVSKDDQWRRKLIECLLPHDYVLIKSRNLWAIWMYGFLKRKLLPAVNNIESECTPSGYGGVMGNKGGVSVRFELCGINMIFLSCHFTAHAENTRDRLNDYLDVIDHQSFRDDDVNVILDHDYVFWMGDLNFRIDDLTKADVEEMIRNKRLSELLKHDQLLKSKNEKLIFKDFNEGEIEFPPTFKFDKHTDTYDSSKKQRVPAWTDRILYMVHRDFALDHHLNLDMEPSKRSPSPSRRIPVRGSPSEVQEHFPSNRPSIKAKQHPEATLLQYTSLEQYKSSDHRPVVADFKLSVPARWFSLPVQFDEPKATEIPCYAHLTVGYSIMDPPNLLHLSESNSILTSKSRTNVQRTPLVSVMLASATGTRDNQNSSTVDYTVDPLPPPTLETTSFDWIGLYPAQFVDLHSDYITYIYASSSVNKSKPQTTKALLNIPGSNRFNQKYYKTKFDSKYLKELAGQPVRLIYMSRTKKCPQGYSSEFVFTD